MEAQELRIGNLILIKGKLTAVKSIYDKGINFFLLEYGHRPEECYDEWKDISPIPLTEEWLLKLEFERDQEGAFILDKYLIDGDNDSGYGMFKILNTNKLIYDCLVSNLNYVHQLQNIYFALTGEELTVKKRSVINESGEIDKEVFDNL